MKKMAKLIIFVAVIILGIGLYYIFAVYEKSEKIDINKILNNPNEYINPVYLKSLSSEQGTQLIDSFDNLLYENCKDGKLNENCTLYFVYSYINARSTLGELGYNSTNHTGENFLVLSNIYNDLKHNFNISTEDDLKGLTIPLLAQYCKIRIYHSGPLMGFFSLQERKYWAWQIVDVNKTNWQSTDMQIFYFKSCLGLTNVSQLSPVLGRSVSELNNKICSILPKTDDIRNTQDLCYVSDYINMKIFCGANVTEEESAIAKNLLSNNYESSYQQDCKNKLSVSYSLV